jgi:hypothetical protein
VAVEAIVTGLLLIAVIMVLVTLTQVMDLRRQAEVRALMNGVLTHRGQATLDEVALLVRENKHYLGRHVAAAHRLREAGQVDAASTRLRQGSAAIQQLAPDFLAALRTLRRLARCVSAIVVVPPIRARAFQTPSLRGLAGLGAVLHYLLLTGRQRVLLRLRTAGGAFRLALHWLHTTVTRITRHDRDRHWRRLRALVADIDTTGDEALIATRQIAEALDAVEFGPILAPRPRS